MANIWDPNSRKISARTPRELPSNLCHRECANTIGPNYFRNNLGTIHPEIFTNEFPSRFLGGIFLVIFTGVRCGVIIAQKPNKSGQILDQRWKIFFVIFTKLIPRRIFIVLQQFWC